MVSQYEGYQYNGLIAGVPTYSKYGSLEQLTEDEVKAQIAQTDAMNYTADILSTAKSLADDDRNWSAEQAQINRDWQAQMSNTAYQRAVQDMQSAGLNPYLAYSQGGASVPSGATASYGGIASSAISGLVNNINTIIKTNTSRDIARENNDTKMNIAFLNALTRIAT